MKAIKKITPVWLGAIAAAVSAALLYGLVDPAQSVWMPKCAFRMLTGFDCPGCGAQRMLHALLHGNVVEAWRANAFLMCALVPLGVMGTASALRTRHPGFYARLNSRWMVLAWVLSITAWGVMRNL